MKILITGTFFYPRVGGVETIIQLLAREFTRMGHQVRVLTSEPNPEPDAFEFEVCRTPNPIEIFQSHRWAEAVLEMGGLRLGWPGVFLRRPCITNYNNWPGKDWKSRLRLWWSQNRRQKCRMVVPSQSMAESIGGAVEITPNPYDSTLFFLAENSIPVRDLVVVGRLCPDKGVDLLLEALACLGQSGIRPNLSIIGLGESMEALKAQTQTLGLSTQVLFKGTLRGEALADELRRHQILIVPSRWNEPFGIVALEGIACGCVVIGSEGGGLPEAIGPCGLTFPNGSAPALAAQIRRLLTNPQEIQALRRHAADHLKAFQPAQAATANLAIFQTLSLA